MAEVILKMSLKKWNAGQPGQVVFRRKIFNARRIKSSSLEIDQINLDAAFQQQWAGLAAGVNSNSPVQKLLRNFIILKFLNLLHHHELEILLVLVKLRCILLKN